ncbi:enoyl CoA hydratase domain-containing protein 1, partial [Allomyces javanicus]
MSTRAALAAARESFRKLGRGQVHLKYHCQLPVALVQLDNPAKHNALSGRMMAELADCVDLLDQHQDKLAAVILTGTGSSFCTGFDLDVASEHVFDPASGRAMATLMHDSLTRLRELPLVSFAAVEGYAIGGGAELTTTTDFRIVTHSTQIR